MSAVAVLELDRLTVHHGQLLAVDGVSLEVAPGEVFAVIGANGAGKSTMLRTIAGLHRPTAGRVVFDGEDVTRLRPGARLARGVSLVPEGRRLFLSLTVEENLLVGAHRSRKGPFDLEAVYGLFGWMAERRRQRAAELSGGEQQAVAIARALVANPRLLLLDEVSLGLAPIVVQRLYETLPRLVDAGVTVLVVEQDVGQAMRAADRVHCLLEGRTTLAGRPGALSRAEIEVAYFGTSLADASSGLGADDEGGAP